LRFDVDLPEDLDRLSGLVAAGRITPSSSAIDVVSVADRVTADRSS
jgi:hypothetical protein